MPPIRQPYGTECMNRRFSDGEIMTVKNNKESILLVDDVPLVIGLLSGLLRHDYEIFTAVNGADAYETALSKHPDLILLTNGVRLELISSML